MFIAQILVFLFVTLVVIRPFYAGYLFTRPPRFRISLRTPADWGVTYEEVRLPTKDGLDLSGWYIPSRNGAAVILVHGHGANRLAMTFHAELLIKGGYGVFLFDMRAHGNSMGKRFFLGETTRDDLLTAVTYLSKRPEVNAAGLGIVGVSIGGALALQAAAQTVAIRAIFVDGATPINAFDMPPNNILWQRIRQFTRLYFMKSRDWFNRDVALPANRAVLPRLASRPVMFVSTGRSDEQMVIRRYYEEATGPKLLWEIPEANHANGWLARPEEYGHKLTTFFQQTLLHYDAESLTNLFPAQTAAVAEQRSTTTTTELDGDVAYDATISMRAANFIGFFMGMAGFMLVLSPYWLIWGDRPLPAQPSLGVVALVFIVGIIVHELLHAVGYIFVGKAPRSSIKYGVQWKALTPYAHCAAPLPVNAYRVAVMLPGLVLGLIPALISLSIGSFWWLVWSGIMLIGAGGDMAVLWAIRAVASEAWVRDHPSKVGCLVLKGEPMDEW